MMNSQNFEQLMNMYGGIKLGCGIAAIIFLIAAIVLFFVLKIPTVFSELSGRGAKKAIEEMTAENESGGLSPSRKIGEDGRRHKKARTGSLGTSKLRKNTGRLTGRLNTGNTAGMRNPAGQNGAFASGQTGGYGAAQNADTYQQNVQPQNTGAYQQNVQPQNTAYMHQSADETAMMNQGGNETTVMNSGTGETTVMNTGAGETTVMNSGAGETSVLNEGAGETMVMHADMVQSQMPEMNRTEILYPESDMTQPMNGGIGETMVLESILPSQDKYFGGKGKAKPGFVIERSIVEIHTNEVI